MKILPAGAEFFNANSRTYGQTNMTKVIVVFSSFANSPKKKRPTFNRNAQESQTVVLRQFSTIRPFQNWCDVSKDYPSLGRNAVSASLQFGSTYFCEK